MIEPSKLEALELARGLEPTAVNLLRVARDTGDAASRWAFTQWELRKRAKAKFSRAEEMLFTREALEQATHEAIAAYHASIFRNLTDGRIADLTAGIGADLIALAPGIGFELDQERAEYARHNLDLHGAEAQVHAGDCMQAEWGQYAYADPARRVEGRRTLTLAEFAPNPMELARRMTDLELGCMKLTPMLPDPALASLGPRLEFISFGGECREALVISGRQAQPGRWAVHVESGEMLDASQQVAISPFRETQKDEMHRYLYEADPAAIRAHCLPHLSEQHGLTFLGDSNGYLTSDAAIDSVWLTRFEVLYSGKGDSSNTKDALRKLDAAKPILKQRGAHQDLAKLSKAFPAYGARPIALVIWPVGKSLRHTIVAIGS
ncbi:MAG: hypothetical protein ACAH95_02230 [Fimbriimonas sp.]